MCSLNADPLHEASEWIEFLRRFWEGRLDRVAQYLEKTKPKRRKK